MIPAVFLAWARLIVLASTDGLQDSSCESNSALRKGSKHNAFGHEEDSQDLEGTQLLQSQVRLSQRHAQTQAELLKQTKMLACRAGTVTITNQAGQTQDCCEEHYEDLYRPIGDVLKEHPGVDGNCWFHFYADYLGQPSDFVESFRQTVQQFSHMAGQGPQKTIHLTNGEKLITHDDTVFGNYGNYAYDDGMCYQMGWMKGQRLDAHLQDLQDAEAWLRLSEQECQRIGQLVEQPMNQSKLTIGYMQDDNMRIVLAASCLFLDDSAPCSKANIEDWVYHLYPKCLLGGDRLTGAAGQIAWCLARACVTEGNVIKHGKDCWPEGLPF